MAVVVAGTGFTLVTGAVPASATAPQFANAFLPIIYPSPVVIGEPFTLTFQIEASSPGTVSWAFVYPRSLTVVSGRGGDCVNGDWFAGGTIQNDSTVYYSDCTSDVLDSTHGSVAVTMTATACGTFTVPVAAAPTTQAIPIPYPVSSFPGATVQVCGTPTQPTFPHPTADLWEGTPSGAIVYADGFPPPTLSLVSGTLPTGITFVPRPANSYSGAADFVGTPAAGTAGGSTRDYPLVIRADNGTFSVTQSFTLTVHIAPPTAPTMLGPTPGNGEVTLNWLPSVNSGGGPLLGYNVIDFSTRAVLNPTLLPPTATSYVVQGLTNGHLYTFAVEAVNAGGPSVGFPNTVTAIPGNPPPVTAPPTLTSAVPSNGMVTLSVTPPPVSAGVGTPTLYEVFKSTTPGGEGAVPVATVSASFATAVVFNLNDGTTYYFTVKAVNLAGLSASSNELSATPVGTPTVPNALRLSATTAGDGQAALSWSTAITNGSELTGYEVYDGTAAGAEGTTPVATTAPGVTSTTIQGLTGGTTYFFTVKAVNAVGRSPASNEVSVTITGTAPTTPGAPALGSPNPGNGQVSLSWSAPTPNGSSAITGYEVYDGTAAGAEGAVPVATTAAGVTSTIVTGLTNGTTYFFTVKAVNAQGRSVASNEVSAIPTAAAIAPAAPSLGAPQAGDSQVTLSWSAPSSDGGSAITGYQLFDGTAAGAEGATPVLSVPATQTAATVPGLTDGTTYFFTVKAVNAVGTSLASNERSATPVVAALQPPPGGASAYGTTPLATAAVQATGPGSLVGTAGGATASVVIPQGSLPPGTTVGLWAVQTSTLPPTPGGYLIGFGVSWNAATSANPPLSLTINDPSITPGMTIYRLDSTGTPVPVQTSDPTLLPYATVGAGTVTITFSDDPGFVIGGGQPKPPHDKNTCVGPLAAGTYDDVHAGVGCVLSASVIVKGDVKVDKGGTLLDQGADVRGDIHADGAAWLIIDGGGIGKDLHISHLSGSPDSGHNYVCGVIIGHDVDVHENSAPIDLGGGASCTVNRGLLIRGHVDIHNNTAAVLLTSVHASGDVDVHNNAVSVGPAVTVTATTVDGDLRIHDNAATASGPAVDAENDKVGRDLDVHGNKAVVGTVAVTLANNIVNGRSRVDLGH